MENMFVCENCGEEIYYSRAQGQYPRETDSFKEVCFCCYCEIEREIQDDEDVC